MDSQTNTTNNNNNNGHKYNQQKGQSSEKPRWDKNNRNRKEGGGKRGAPGGGNRGRGRKDGAGRRGGKVVTRGEENALVDQLYAATKGYYDRNYLEGVLREHGTVEKALSFLNHWQENSWSSKVKKQSPFMVPSPSAQKHTENVQNTQQPSQQTQQQPQTQNLLTITPTQPLQLQSQPPPQSQPPSQSQPQTQQPSNNGVNQNQKKNQRKQAHHVEVEKKQEKEEKVVQQPEEHKVHEEEYNADSKIEALQKQFENELRGIEQKRQLLTSLQQEIATFTADRDTQIDALTKEKEQLSSKKKSLEDELQSIQKRLEQIDESVTILKQEKVQKIRFLEEKSRSVLEDKGN